MYAVAAERERKSKKKKKKKKSEREGEKRKKIVPWIKRNNRGSERGSLLLEIEEEEQAKKVFVVYCIHCFHESWANLFRRQQQQLPLPPFD